MNEGIYLIIKWGIATMIEVKHKARIIAGFIKELKSKFCHCDIEKFRLKSCFNLLIRYIDLLSSLIKPISHKKAIKEQAQGPGCSKVGEHNPGLMRN